MQRFVIHGGVPLEGSVTPSGNRNLALPLLAASLLTDEPVSLHNVPRSTIVEDMLSILSELGVEIEEHNKHTLTLRARNVQSTNLNTPLCQKLRASVLFAGPMLARYRHVTLPILGADVIGRRRIESYFTGLGELGAQVEVTDGYYLETTGLRGTDCFLVEASVIGTENLLMAATLAEGQTVIHNAASEPHVSDLARALRLMGASISGIGTNNLEVQGVKKLHGAQIEINPDHIEVGAFIAMAAATHGQVNIRTSRELELGSMPHIFERMGISMDIQTASIIIPYEQSLKIDEEFEHSVPQIQDGAWPAFPTDLMSMMMVLATQCNGTILFYEKMYEARMFFVDYLMSMGAKVILCDQHRALVVGPSQLYGVPSGLPSPEIRAGFAMIGAALCAKGQTAINNTEQVDRYYEDFDAKLRGLGARITRESN